MRVRTFMSGATVTLCALRIRRHPGQTVLSTNGLMYKGKLIILGEHIIKIVLLNWHDVNITYQCFCYVNFYSWPITKSYDIRVQVSFCQRYNFKYAIDRRNDAVLYGLWLYFYTLLEATASFYRLDYFLITSHLIFYCILRYVYWGEYPLSFAACLGQEECYRLILARGADPDKQDTNGNTVLHMLVIYEKTVRWIFDLVLSSITLAYT